MKIAFFGTPAFAVPSLEELLRSRHPIAAVVTQPDQPAGRGMRRRSCPVKEAAQESALQLFQPQDLQEKRFLKTLQSLSPACAVVAAFGRLLPRSLLQLFPYGAVNLHPSLLPSYRGAAPIQWALIRGETRTGVTIFQMDEACDHGPILLQESSPIRPEDTALTLSGSLAVLGSRLLLKALDLLEEGALPVAPQDDALATGAPRLSKEDGIIHWEKSCQEIHNLVRGAQPWPSAMTRWGGKLLKIFLTKPHPDRHDPSLAPGTVAQANPLQGLWVQTGKGQLRVDRLQLEAGGVLETAPFLRGHPIPSGTRFSYRV